MRWKKLAVLYEVQAGLGMTLKPDRALFVHRFFFDLVVVEMGLALVPVELQEGVSALSEVSKSRLCMQFA